MKKHLIATAILALAGSSAMFAQAANVQGGTSNSANVQPGISDFPPFVSPLGYSGLEMRKPDGNMSSSIDLYGGPVTQARSNATANQAGPFYANMPILPIQIAQVWHYQAGSSAPAHDGVNIYTLRQIRTVPLLSGYPRFGGLVVGEVKGTGASANPNSNPGNGVYFGEWSQAVSSPSTGNSTNLNMADASRTVWFVGDNAVSNMDALVNSNNQFQASYNVVGIRQTGVGTNLPHAPNLYTGVLTADYVTGRIGNPLSGSLARTGDPTVTINADIQSDGRFVGADNNGRFYNDAAALAGIYTGGGASDHIAFGGSRQ